METINKRIVNIRAHHGMCLAFFRGKGYDADFSEHMEQVKRELETNQQIMLLASSDEICSCCPHNQKGKCITAEQVEKYDNKVLELCGFMTGMQMDYKTFRKRIEDKIFQPGRRKEICGDCQWDEICT